MNNILFVCTGNYYRSRYAEYIFNRLALEQGISWFATSRGIGVYKCNNEGPISQHTLQALKALSISVDSDVRMPEQISETDVSEATLIIGLKETEHRDFMISEFPQHQKKFEFWQIDDVDFAVPEMALPAISKKIKKLISELS